jgi:hypothetical protein
VLCTVQLPAREKVHVLAVSARAQRHRRVNASGIWVAMRLNSFKRNFLNFIDFFAFSVDVGIIGSGGPAASFWGVNGIMALYQCVTQPVRDITFVRAAPHWSEARPKVPAPKCKRGLPALRLIVQGGPLCAC